MGITLLFAPLIQWFKDTTKNQKTLTL